MNELLQAIALLRQHLAGRRDQVALASDTDPAESSLYATPAGYVHFACTLLETALAAEEGKLERDTDQSAWSGEIKSACIDLPGGSSTFLVGAYVCPSHEHVLARLQTLLAGDLPPGTLLSHDPALAKPPPPESPCR